MKKQIIKTTGKKLIQIITKTPVKGKKNRLGKQYYISETRYEPIKK
jgi:hypothetical protein